MSIDVMKQALEALEIEQGEGVHAYLQLGKAEHIEAAITALRAAIEQAQDPVAWVGPSWMNPKTRTWQNDAFAPGEIEGWTPLYTAPPREKNS